MRIADGSSDGSGHLIVCTRYDPTVEADEPGRTLANGDLLRIEAVTPQGLRRPQDADPATGQPRWMDHQFLYANDADAELGYAVTIHTAQGRAVRTGLAGAGVFGAGDDRVSSRALWHIGAPYADELVATVVVASVRPLGLGARQCRRSSTMRLRSV